MKGKVLHLNFSAKTSNLVVSRTRDVTKWRACCTFLTCILFLQGNAADDLMFSDLLDILTHCGIHPAIIQQIIEKIRSVLKSERDRIAKEERESYLKLEAKLNEEAERQNDEHRKRMDNINAAIEAERENLKEEQRNKQLQLESYSNSIHKQSLALRKHFDEILARDQALRRRETEFQRREQALKDQEKQLHKDMTSLCNDQLELLRQKMELEATKKGDGGSKVADSEEDEKKEEGTQESGEVGESGGGGKSKDGSEDRSQQTLGSNKVRGGGCCYG